MEKSRAEVIKMIEALKIKGSDAILLACTELGTLIKPENMPLPIYDTTVLHVKKAIELSFS